MWKRVCGLMMVIGMVAGCLASRESVAADGAGAAGGGEGVVDDS